MNQEGPPAQGVEKGQPDRYVLPETAILAALGCADLLATTYLIATGRAGEGNPLMRDIGMRYGVAGFVSAKALFLGIPLSIAEAARRRSPRFVRTALRVGIVAYAALLAVAWTHA